MDLGGQEGAQDRYRQGSLRGTDVGGGESELERSSNERFGKTRLGVHCESAWGRELELGLCEKVSDCPWRGWGGTYWIRRGP